MFFSSPNIFVDGICFPTRFEICLILFHGISWWNLVSQTLQTATSKLRRHMQTMIEKERAIWRNNVNTNTKHNKHIHILTDIFEDITNIIYIYIYRMVLAKKTVCHTILYMVRPLFAVFSTCVNFMKCFGPYFSCHAGILDFVIFCIGCTFLPQCHTGTFTCVNFMPVMA